MATESFVEFLSDYLENHENPVGSDESLPFRVLNNVTREEELQGECIDIALQHLKSCSCPGILALSLTRKAVDDILCEDLSCLVQTNENEEKVYDTVKVAHLVFTSIHAVCVEWKNILPPFLHKLPIPPQYSEYGIKNTRRKMEDRHSVITNLNLLLGLEKCPLMQWYAVYDGHGGLDASVYAAKQLYLNFTKQKDFHSNIGEALKLSIFETDEDFCAKAKRERLRSGTTAVVAVMVEKELHVAWVGDSQAVLVRDGKPLMIMNPHKPEREDEKRRIEDMGGCVVWFGAWRVNGSLSVSRAIGDADHKPFVTGEADAVTIPLDGNEDFLCLACDGFWDVFDGDDLIRLVREHLNENKPFQSTSEVLCLKAKSKGSSDNITVLVIFLRNDLNLGENVEPEEVSKASDVTEVPGPPVNGSNNDNNNNSHNSDNSTEEATETLAVLQGLQVGLEHKQKIPHKLLTNYVRNSQQKKHDKGAVIVTKTSPHARLPHSLHNPRLGNDQCRFGSNISPLLRRRDTRGSLLSLSTIESLTEFPTSKKVEKKASCELPSIFVNQITKNEQHRKVGLAAGFETSGKALGHRAPSKHARGRTDARLPYRASLVVTREPQGYYRSSSRNRGYSRSNPEDPGFASREEDTGNTKIAIINSLSPSLKPRHQKKYMKNDRQIVKLVYRGRRRSRSAF